MRSEKGENSISHIIINMTYIQGPTKFPEYNIYPDWIDFNKNFKMYAKKQKPKIPE